MCIHRKWKRTEWAKGKMADCKFNGNVKEELDSMLSQLKSQRPGRRNNFFTAKWTIKIETHTEQLIIQNYDTTKTFMYS